MMEMMRMMAVTMETSTRLKPETLCREGGGKRQRRPKLLWDTGRDIGSGAGAGAGRGDIMINLRSNKARNRWPGWPHGPNSTGSKYRLHGTAQFIDHGVMPEHQGKYRDHCHSEQEPTQSGSAAQQAAQPLLLDAGAGAGHGFVDAMHLHHVAQKAIDVAVQQAGGEHLRARHTVVHPLDHALQVRAQPTVSSRPLR